MAELAKYGVLLVTGGRTHQENYSRAFAADPRCRLVGLVDESNVRPERAAWNAELAKELGVPVFSDLNEALRRKDVQIVCVCSEPERRARMGSIAAAAGKHLYIDKPVGVALDQIDALKEAVQRTGVRSQMFTMVRTPSATRARQAIQSGEVGTVQALHCDLMFAKGHAGTIPKLKPRAERYPPPRFTFVDSKREVFTTAIYSLVLMQWLTGRKFVDVRAVTANYFFAEHLANDVEDFGALLLRLDGGVWGTLTAGRIGWTSHPAAGPNQLVIVGSKKTITVDAYRPRLEIASDEPAWLPPRRNPDDPMGFWLSTQTAAGVQPKRGWHLLQEAAANDTSYFVDCIEANRESDMNVAVCAHASEVILAAYKSAADGKTISLPLERT